VLSPHDRRDRENRSLPARLLGRGGVGPGQHLAGRLPVGQRDQRDHPMLAHRRVCPAQHLVQSQAADRHRAGQDGSRGPNTGSAGRRADRNAEQKRPVPTRVSNTGLATGDWRAMTAGARVERRRPASSPPEGWPSSTAQPGPSFIPASSSLLHRRGGCRLKTAVETACCLERGALCDPVGTLKCGLDRQGLECHDPLVQQVAHLAGASKASARSRSRPGRASSARGCRHR